MTELELIGWYKKIIAMPTASQNRIFSSLVANIVAEEKILLEEKNGKGTIKYPAEHILRRSNLTINYEDSEKNTYKLKPAPEHGNNPGWLYITINNTYMGKIKDGSIKWTITPPVEQRKIVMELLDKPKEMAIAYGKATGMCSICGLKLTNPESIEAGIGPICASKF